MATYRLTENAKEDLRRIYRRGLREYGQAQADQYYNALFDRFEQIAEQPFLYPAVDDSCAHFQILYFRILSGCPRQPQPHLHLNAPSGGYDGEWVTYHYRSHPTERCAEERICSFDHYSGQLILCDIRRRVFSFHRVL
jgi:plasmid stabilization system protein ParE